MPIAIKIMKENATYKLAKRLRMLAGSTSFDAVKSSGVRDSCSTKSRREDRDNWTPGDRLYTPQFNPRPTYVFTVKETSRRGTDTDIVAVFADRLICHSLIFLRAAEQ